jgi:signal transduction histidine kinase
MSGDRISELQALYTEALRNYIETRSEGALFTISKLSKEFLSEDIGPDQVTEIHSSALGKVIGRLTHDEALSAFQRSTEPLLELMMNYAMAYQGYVERHKKKLAEYEMGGQFKDLEKLASIGLLSLGMMNETGNQLEDIASYSKMMTRGGADNKECLKVIMQRAAQAMGMLKTVYLYSQRVAKEETKSVNLNDLLAESINLVKTAVKLDSISIQTNYQASVSINMNISQMQQAFVNLIANAIDSLHGSGNLTISTTIDMVKKRAYLAAKVVCVSNKTAKTRSIFNLPLAKESVALSIARSIIRRQGGILEVDNGAAGTTIIVRLPVPDKLDNFLKGVTKPG